MRLQTRAWIRSCSRRRGERGRRTNHAGIDLFNATWYKLLKLRSYDRRLIENTMGEVEWYFRG